MIKTSNIQTLSRTYRAVAHASGPLDDLYGRSPYAFFVFIRYS
jgi:hypothetical protein